MAQSDAFTQSDADTRYVAQADAFTQSAADTLYVAQSDAFTQAEADSLYLGANPDDIAIGAGAVTDSDVKLAVEGDASISGTLSVAPGGDISMGDFQ